MSYIPPNANGQTTAASSAPVVLASDQVSTLTGDTGFNSLVTGGGVKTYTFTTSSAGAQTLLANTDLRGYTWIEVYYTSVGVGLALTGQYAQTSGGTYTSFNSFGTGTLAPVSAIGTAVSTLYYGPTRGNYFQLAVSALTSGTFSGTVTLRTVAPVGITVNAGLNAGGNLIGKVGIDQTTVGTTNAVSLAQLGANTIATSNGVTGTGVQRNILTSDYLSTATVRGGTTTSSSGLSVLKVLSAATSNAANVKASAAAIYGWHLGNTSTGWRYVRFFNLAVSPTVGTSSPTFVIPLPPGGGAVMVPDMQNFALTTGFSIAITAGAIDLDTTVTAANDVVGTIWYV